MDLYTRASIRCSSRGRGRGPPSFDKAALVVLLERRRHLPNVQARRASPPTHSRCYASAFLAKNGGRGPPMPSPPPCFACGYAGREGGEQKRCFAFLLLQLSNNPACAGLARFTPKEIHPHTRIIAPCSSRPQGKPFFQSFRNPKRGRAERRASALPVASDIMRLVAWRRHQEQSTDDGLSPRSARAGLTACNSQRHLGRCLDGMRATSHCWVLGPSAHGCRTSPLLLCTWRKIALSGPREGLRQPRRSRRIPLRFVTFAKPLLSKRDTDKIFLAATKSTTKTTSLAESRESFGEKLEKAQRLHAIAKGRALQLRRVKNPQQHTSAATVIASHSRLKNGVASRRARPPDRTTCSGFAHNRSAGKCSRNLDEGSKPLSYHWPGRVRVGIWSDDKCPFDRAAPDD
jgi:hypothetical protein